MQTYNLSSNRTLTILLNNIGKCFILRNIEKYISYHNIDENITQLTYMLSINYHSNFDDVLQNIRLKVLNCFEDCHLVLDLINIYYNRLSIEQADYIFINRGVLHMLKLTNDKKPDSNIAIFIDIELIEQDLTQEYNKRRSVIFRNKVIKFGLILYSVIFAYLGYELYRQPKTCSSITNI